MHYEQFVKIIWQWMSSWMQPVYFANKVDYVILNSLFYNYIL